jgi:hypothetical protein
MLDKGLLTPFPPSLPHVFIFSFRGVFNEQKSNQTMQAKKTEKLKRSFKFPLTKYNDIYEFWLGVSLTVCSTIRFFLELV